jgi:hypothetical protein
MHAVLYLNARQQQIIVRSHLHTSLMYEAGDEEPLSMAAAETTTAAAPACLYGRRPEI